MSESSEPLHLIPDAPIADASFDRLDRMNFVRSFAKAIRAVEGFDSVVLALAGPWGSGKSSLLNLVAAELDKDEVPPLLMRFNPWWFTGTGTLVPSFLQQLGAALGREEVRDLLGEGVDLLDRLARAISPHEQIAPVDDPSGRDIEQLRDRINRLLRNSPRRVLIFMDDIDRLTPDEMTQLLLIVRAVADFPNTTYVLAFDHEVVVEAIAEKLGVDGRTYLEKVVLLQIDVPMPGRMTLERMVVGQLETIDPAAKTLDDEARRHFRLLFEGGVKHYLATPRACTRLLNVIRFTFPMLAGQVYFPDMLGIACLMSFGSQAIQQIRSSSEAFVGPCDPTGDGWINLREFHLGWLATIKEKDRASIESIVRTLFPKVAWSLNGPLRGEDYVPTWEHQKRICCAKHFETYFRLGLSAGQAAEHQWHNVIELLDDATAFSRALDRFGPIDQERGTASVGELLQRAGDFVNEQADSQQAAKLFAAIMRRGDQIAAIKDSGSDHQLKIDHVHRVCSVLVDCLLHIDDPAQRLESLRESVGSDGGLLTSAELLDALDYRPDIFADDDTEMPSPEANTAKLVEVLKLLDTRILEASASGELAEHPLFMKVAQKWWLFGRKSKSQQWIKEACEEDEALVDALTQLWTGAEEAGGEISGAQILSAAQSLPLDWLVEVLGRRALQSRCEWILERRPAWLTDESAAILEALAYELQLRAQKRRRKA